MNDPQPAPDANVTPIPPLDPRLEPKDDSVFYGALGIAAIIGSLAALVSLVFLVDRALRGFLVYPAAVTLLCIGVAIWASIKVANQKEEERRERVQLILGPRSQSDYFERLVNINVENLSAYYVTVKGHANKSFITSILVGLAGFAMIGIGIYLSVTSGKNAPSVVTLSGVSGVATEFISAVFFYLYSKTVRQMKEYHDSLLSVQNILLSFKLVGDTTDPTEKSRMVEAMLQYLVGRQHPVVGSATFVATPPASGKTSTE